MKVSVFDQLHGNNFRNVIQIYFAHNVKLFELKKNLLQESNFK
jgi:hypothetical protein